MLYTYGKCMSTCKSFLLKLFLHLFFHSLVSPIKKHELACLVYLESYSLLIDLLLFHTALLIGADKLNNPSFSRII